MPLGASVSSSGAVSQAKTIAGTRHLPAWAKTLVMRSLEIPWTNLATAFDVAGATIRFYCVTGNCRENQPGAESSPRRSSKPIPPVSNTSPNLDVVMDECHREAVPMLKCSGHISNKTDYLLKVAVGNSPVVDDDGNDVGVTPGMSMNHIQFTGDGGFTRLMPQVSTKFEFTLEDNYVKVRTLSMTLNFRVGTDEEQMFFFKDVPVY